MANANTSVMTFKLTQTLKSRIKTTIKKPSSGKASDLIRTAVEKYLDDLDYDNKKKEFIEKIEKNLLSDEDADYLVNFVKSNRAK